MLNNHYDYITQCYIIDRIRCDRKYHNLLVGVLRDLITHSSAQVRRYIAIMLGVGVYVSVCGQYDIVMYLTF